MAQTEHEPEEEAPYVIVHWAHGGKVELEAGSVQVTDGGLLVIDVDDITEVYSPSSWSHIETNIDF